MSQWSTYLNYDIMGDLVFGRRFDVMTSDAHRSVPRLIMNSTSFVYTVRSVVILCRLYLLTRGIADRLASSLPCLSRLSPAVYSPAAYLVFPSSAARWPETTESSIGMRKTS